MHGNESHEGSAKPAARRRPLSLSAVFVNFVGYVSSLGMDLEDGLRLGLDEFLHIRTVHLSDIDRTGRINSNRRRIAEARHLVEDPAFFEAHHEQAVVVAAVDQIQPIAFDKETPRHADVRPLIQELAAFVENLHAVVRSVGDINAIA